MRLERTTKDYVGGSGKTTYESKNFSVTRWVLGDKIKTTISWHVANFLKIEFDGEQKFNSDEECMEQLTCEEILSVLDAQKGKAFAEGGEDKAKQIRDCLAI